MSLINRPNHILERQRYFQQPSNKPLFLRGPRDKLFVYTVFAILGTGVVGSLCGVVRMARGLKD